MNKKEQTILEEAAWKYAPDLPSYNIGGGYLPPQSRYDLRTAFTDGAEWQKEQMLKDAVEAPLYRDGDCLTIDIDMEKLGYTEDDKAKVIIVKEDEQRQKDIFRTFAEKIGEMKDIPEEIQKVINENWFEML